jgi:hypothetical protein
VEVENESLRPRLSDPVPLRRVKYFRVFRRGFLSLSLVTAMLVSTFYPVWHRMGFLMFLALDALVVLPAAWFLWHEETKHLRRMDRLLKLERRLEEEGVDLDRLKEVNRLVEGDKPD